MSVSRLLAMLLLLPAGLAAHAQVYVDAGATGANDGTSWADAYIHLQDGLQRARQAGQPKEVWVAAGTYYPDRGASVTLGSRTATFLLNVNGLSLYGGFAGGETMRSERDPEANPTILSGDLAGNDDASPASRSENSLHVVTANVSGSSSVVRLDGFVVTAGNANLSFPDGDGGGLRIPGGNAGRVNVANCRFIDNRAVRTGGGIYSDSNSVKNIVNCVFEGNSAGFGGGGGLGGNPVTMTVANCLFIGNSAGSSGGVGAGGGMSVSGGSGNIINCTFTENTSSGRGGAGLAQTASTSAPVISNSIFWQNVDGMGFSDERAQLDRVISTAPTPTVQHSIVQGLTTAFLGAGGNFDADPLFEDAVGGDYRLAAGSPAIDAGDQTLLPADGADVDDNGDITEKLPIDLDGQPRVQCGDVDLGAYESSGGSGGLELFCPADVMVECGDSIDPADTGEASAVDACSGAPAAVSYSDEVVEGCGESATILRTWSVDDGGGMLSCVQTITVVDTTAPALSIPADVVIACDLGSDPSVTGEASAFDDCDDDVTVTYEDEIAEGDCAPYASIITRTWTATDACGNSVSDVQVISLVDDTPPTIECPPAVTVELGAGDCAASGLNLGSPVVADSCNEVTVMNDAPAVFPPGQTIVTWTAIDACGNFSTCEQVVTVIDTQEPFLQCSVAQPMLWPPNHGMVNVGLSVVVDDDCDSGLPPTVVVYANEDDDEPTGDGMHSPDALDIGPDTLRLRAERKGDGNGRVYLIVVSATDGSGNVGTSTCVVVVPHNRGKGSIQAVTNMAAAAQQFFQDNGVPPAGFVVVGDGPVLGPNQ